MRLPTELASTRSNGLVSKRTDPSPSSMVGALALLLLAALVLPSSAVEAQEGEPTPVEAAVPEAAVPEAAVPEAAIPEAAIPEGATPEDAVPEDAVEALDQLLRLVDRLEERWDLSRDGDEWELWPENDRDDFERLTVRGGQVRVDGRPIELQDLDRFVDDDARAIGELAALAMVVERAGGVDRVRDSVEERPRERRERRRRSDSQVSFGSSLVIDADESVRDVVLIGGPLEVYGEVEGNATVVLGSAVVSGRVDGSLTVVGGSVSLLDGAWIEGDVVAVGGSVDQEGDVEIDGEIVQVDIAEAIDVGDVRIDLGDMGLGWPDFQLFGFSISDLVSRILKTFLVAICLVFLAFLAPRRTLGVSQRVRLEPWKAILVGLVTLVLFPALLALVVALLTLSIVGIPLLLAVVPLMFVILLLLYLLGLAGVCHAWGRFLANRFAVTSLGLVALVLLGLLSIDVWSYLGEIASVLPWPFKIFALLFLVGGFCLKFIAWTMGLGAAVLEQFSPLPPDGSAATAFPAPLPPIPPPAAPVAPSGAIAPATVAPATVAPATVAPATVAVASADPVPTDGPDEGSSADTIEASEPPPTDGSGR